MLRAADTIDFTTGFTKLWGAIPNATAVGIVLASIGALILIITIVPWLWQKRKGGGSGLGGFPWMGVVIAALLAGPTVVFPVILNLIGLVVNLAIAGVNFFIALFS